MGDKVSDEVGDEVGAGVGGAMSGSLWKATLPGELLIRASSPRLLRSILDLRVAGTSLRRTLAALRISERRDGTEGFSIAIFDLPRVQ